MFNYDNLGVLRRIASGWVWDNAMPYMAECIYENYNILRTRLLPERCNGYSVRIPKFHAFLLVSEMILGVLPRQIATFDLPVTFGEIMMIGSNDPVRITDNKEAKLKCLLHYPSAILRYREDAIKSSGEVLEFRRSRMRLKMEMLCPGSE